MKITLEEFLKSFGFPKDKKLDLAELIYFSSIYCYKEKLNWRRQTMRIRKILKAVKDGGIRLELSQAEELFHKLVKEGKVQEVKDDEKMNEQMEKVHEEYIRKAQGSEISSKDTYLD